MPRAKSNSGGKNGLPTFIASKLSEEQQAFVQQHLLDDAGMVDFAVKLVEGGYKLSLSWDDWNDCVVCTITLKGDKPGDNGSALSSRGPGVYEALSVAAFKFHEVFAGDLRGAPKEASKQQWG